MNRNNLKILGGASVALITILFAIQLDHGDPGTRAELLFPDLKSRMNDITSLTITRADTQFVISKSQGSGSWVISSRDNYPVDIGKLRKLLLQLAEAKIVEKKTTNPDLYDQLGVQDPGVDGGLGTHLDLQGPDLDYGLIIGNASQGGDRYVRFTGTPQSWLIDQNPEVPDSAGAWLARDIIDIKSADVRLATISHADGEQIRIRKASADAPEFDVVNIPAGRELSYSTVANSIAGALNALTLEDVRKAAVIAEDAVTTTFETFDGTRVVVLTEQAAGDSWITLTATSDENSAGIASAINERVQDWQFKIADYKANQLVRRWKDILKAETD